MTMKPKTANNTVSRRQHQMKQTAKTTFTSTISNSVRHHHCINDIHLAAKVIKVSVQESQQIGQNQYKKAIKHMMKINSLQKKSKQKQTDKFSEFTSEHTFKPKINNSSQLNYLYQSMSLSAQKLNNRNHSKQREDPKQKFYDRLIKWGKNHDDRVRDNFVRGKVNRDSLDKSLQGTVRNSRQKTDKIENARLSIQKMEQKFLYSLRSSEQKKRQQPKTYANGELNFYQRHAKAVARKNGETYYYTSNIHSTA